MQRIFLEILSMGIAASWMIVAVLFWRVLFRKAPKWISCLLWILVGVRLVCPFHLESPFGLVPSRPGFSDAGQGSVLGQTGNGVPYLASGEKKATGKGGKNGEGNSGEPGDGQGAFVEEAAVDGQGGWEESKPELIAVLAVIWAAGVAAMLLYLVASYVRIRRRVSTATHFRRNIWESEFVDSPFILGLVRPRIYIPYHMEEGQLGYVLAHENAHLERRDHIFKAVAFLILSAYWFHPLVWLSYVLLCRDIELACDEKAVLAMDTEQKKGYLFALLQCNSAGGRTNVCPLAFGEVGIKERVMHMKTFKKPSIWMTAIALAACITTAACLLTNQQEPKAEGEAVARENGMGLEPLAEHPFGGGEALEAKPASVDLSGSAGADGPILYYVDAQKIIFGGSFGLYVHDKASGQIVASLDLEYIGCNMTQGDAYCDIGVEKNGRRVYLNPMAEEKLYTFDIVAGTLEVRDYKKPKNIWKDDSLKLFRVKEAAKASYMDGKTKKVCELHCGTNNLVGECSYEEYGPDHHTDLDEADVYHPLFLQEG